MKLKKTTAVNRNKVKQNKFKKFVNNVLTQVNTLSIKACTYYVPFHHR